MKQGTYIGKGTGFEGDIIVQVTVDESKILDIKILEEHETPQIGHVAFPILIERAIKDQTYKPEPVAGARVTSMAFHVALKDAMLKADADLTRFDAKVITEKKEITLECDVIVVGSGAAGLTAALVASQRGKKVIVLEKTGLIGGASAMAGGGTLATGSKLQKESGYEDTPEKLVEDMLANGHYYNDKKTVELYANTVGNAIDWLTSETGGNVKYSKLSKPSRSLLAVGRGLAVIQTLQERFEALGGTIYSSTEAKNLIITNGAVTGIQACSYDTNYTIHARNVILACGGYGHNKDLVKEEYKQFVYAGHSRADGDALKMVEPLQADLINMDLVNVQPNSIIMPSGIGQYANPGVMNAYQTSGAFLVDQNGRRFANEVGSSFDLKNMQAKNERQYLILDEASYNAFQNGMINSVIYSKEKAEKWLLDNYKGNPTFVKAESIQELAKKIHVDPTNLCNTVKEYNDLVGKVDSFGRKIVLPISLEGPFFAIRMYNRYYATLGGLHINDHMQVLNLEQKEIAGLYAAGEVVGGLEGDIYYPGTLFSWAITSGYNAGLEVSQ